MVAAGAEAIRPAHRGRRVAAISLVFVAAGPIIASVMARPIATASAHTAMRPR